VNVLNEYIIKLGVNVDQSVSRTIQGVTSSFKALGAATAKLCNSDDLSSWSKNLRNKWDNFNVNIRQQSAAITNQGKYIKGIIEQTMAVFWGPLKMAMDQNGVLDALPGLNALKMGRIKITKDLAELSRKIPINFEGLAKIAAEGLKIRVPEENITKYTELLGKFATAVNASSQVAATSMNTVFSTFGTSFEDFQRIADTVSFYQTRSRVSSEAFLETMGSLSGAARVAGLNEAEVAALSATWARITSLKGTYQASAEGGVSGRAFRELFKNLQDLTRIEADFAKHREINKLSTKDADKYSAIKLAGLDIKRLNTLLTGKNKIDAILYFLEQVMLQTPNARDKVLNVLFGKKLSEVSYKIAELLPELRENLALANKGISGFEGKTETLFQERVNGVKEQFALLQNRMASLGATIGVQFLPIVSKLLTYTTDFVNLLEKHSDILINILKGFLVFQGARLGLGVFKGLKNVWGLLKFVGVFVGRLNWIGLALTALGAVATAVVAKWDTVKSWFSKVGEWFSGLFGRKK
jgi:TP901 family phage tail tape measure protein